MTIRQAAPNLLSWGSGIDPAAIEQAARTARLPFVAGHVALMPDAHVGIGATVGSVIPTQSAIIPSAVGVDIGCGMAATETSLTASDLPDDLSTLMPLVEQRIPAGVGKGHASERESVSGSRGIVVPRSQYTNLLNMELSDRQIETAESQYGTLGSGNHFVEVCLDERDHVWTVLHSGSRGIGNQLAQNYIADAKGLMRSYFIQLEDPDLAYFVEGTSEFSNYITDMTWAQSYAMGSRGVMDQALVDSLFQVVGHGKRVNTINCHHNFTNLEYHNNGWKWITRKGAIKAVDGMLGVIPGSMGTKSYIVEGLGNAASYNSCSHGAGRRMSRSKARQELSAESLTQAMRGKTWNADRAQSLVDEHPDAYKDIDQVMNDQKDLVKIRHTLHQIFNYKG